MADRLSTIAGAAAGDNLGNVVVFDANTNTQYLSFRPFDTATNQYIGQMSIALGDVNNDGIADLILGTRGRRAGKVKVFDGAGIIAGTVTQPTQTIFVGFPLSPDGSAASNGYKQGLTVAAADVNGNGIADIIAASRTGARRDQRGDGLGGHGCLPGGGARAAQQGCRQPP